MLTRIALLAVIPVILSECKAHMILQYPVPYGNATLNNSPLDGTGADYPCKLRAGVYELTQMNYWTAGEVQTIRFIGSAVHGGGSCQFSVTKDLQPTKSSQWKVMHSVIGGCPASVSGNLPGGASGHGAATFDVMLPKEIMNGRYSFAWTWFNKEGNREMYMNCSPITVNGGGTNATFFESLPDMFVANLPSTDCATVEDYDFAFPEPGDSVVTGNNANIATTLVGSGCVSVTALGAGHTATGSVERLEAVSATTTFKQLPMMPSNTPFTQSYTVIDAQAASFRHESAIHSLVVQASSSLEFEPAIRTSTVPNALPADTCIPCNSGENVLCIGQYHYGLCNSGCATSQPLALGTVCLDGKILKRGVRPVLTRDWLLAQ